MRSAPHLKVVDGGAREAARRAEVLEEFVQVQTLACGPSSYRRRLNALERADRPRCELANEASTWKGGV